MSDILDRKIAAAMTGPRIDIASALDIDELRDSYLFQLEQLTRLSAAIDILFPGEQRVGEGSIACAIRLLEEATLPTGADR